MKTLLLEKNRTLTISEQEGPALIKGNSLIHVEVASIGGSEYLGFNNTGIRPLPNIMGHGITGINDKGQRVAVYPLSGCGNCNYCKVDQVQLCNRWSLIGVHTNGGFAQKVSAPQNSLFELPDTLSWEQSAFIEPFANSVNAWELSKSNSEDSIAVIGAGGLGLGIVASAFNSGCKDISVAEPSKNRRNAASELGANILTKSLTGTFDVVFDTVGSLETKTQAIQMTKKGGKCIYLGFETPMQEINISELIRYQKHLIGSFVYSKKQFNQAIDLAHKCKSDWVKSISFEEVESTLLRFLSNDFKLIKVALRPNG